MKENGFDWGVYLFSLNVQQTDIKLLFDVKELNNTSFFALNRVVVDNKDNIKGD